MRSYKKELVIETAIREYKESIVFGITQNTINAINMMHEAYIMCAPLNIKGVDRLKETIIEAEEKIKLQHYITKLFEQSLSNKIDYRTSIYLENKVVIDDLVSTLNRVENPYLIGGMGNEKDIRNFTIESISDINKINTSSGEQYQIKIYVYKKKGDG